MSALDDAGTSRHGYSQEGSGTQLGRHEYNGNKGQLTIFYGGTTNVYDNVPIDKAQAIMLLAGESSSLDPHVLKRAPAFITTPSGGGAASTSRHVRLPSVSELEADRPLARKHSLQRFFEKRRDRIINKAR